MSRIYLSPPDLCSADLDAVHAVLASNWVAPVGPDLSAFESAVCELVGHSHAVALNSGTAALHMALEVLGITAGDAVACASFTFAASANPIIYCGAEPIFIGSESATWNMDPIALEDALKANASIRAVIVVHLYGQCAQMERIVDICQRYGVYLIEDAAEALGASYAGRAAGSFGDLSFFSFNGNKIITTSGGGMLLSSHAAWIEEALYLATQAKEPVSHYEHVKTGYNYRMSNVLAGLGLSQLRDLPRRIAVKRSHYEAYAQAIESIKGVRMMPIFDQGVSNYWLSCIELDPELHDRDALLEAFAQNDIEARPLWKPLHLQPLFQNAKYYGQEVESGLFDNGLCLPSGSGMSETERARVIQLLQTTLREPCGEGGSV